MVGGTATFRVATDPRAVRRRRGAFGESALPLSAQFDRQGQATSSIHGKTTMNHRSGQNPAKKPAGIIPNKKVEQTHLKDRVPERLQLGPPRSTSKVERGGRVFCLRRSIQEVRHD